MINIYCNYKCYITYYFVNISSLINEREEKRREQRERERERELCLVAIQRVGKTVLKN